MKKTAILMIMLLLAAFAFANGGQDQQQAQTEAPAAVAEPVEFSLINGSEPESLDPHLISGVPEHRIYEGLFEGLMAYDPETADPVPGLAKSWEVSNDGLTYTFNLREAYWSDGVQITAQTVVDSWIRELDPVTAAPYAWFPSMFIAGAADFNSGEAGADSVQIRALDDMTFQMDLIGPLPYVLGALPHYSFAVVPLHAIEEFGSEWTNPENFVGNGPFSLESWIPQDSLTMVPNPTYWDAEVVQLDRVIYLPVDDNNTAYNMYLNGEVDWMTTVPLDQITVARLRDDYQVNPQLASYYYLLNVEREPLTDVRVRKALSLSIDRETLVERITQAGQVPATGIVPDMTGYPALDRENYDIAMAQDLLAEAGFAGGEGFPTLQILYNTSEGHKKIAEYIQAQWLENLGIEVELFNQEWKTYLTTAREHDFDISRQGWVGDYQDPNTFLDMFVTGAGMNHGQFASAEYDALIGEAATLETGPARFDLLRQAETIFVEEEAAMIPLYYYVTLNMIDMDKWGGWYPNTMDYHPPKDIYLK